VQIIRLRCFVGSPMKKSYIRRSRLFGEDPLFLIRMDERKNSMNISFIYLKKFNYYFHLYPMLLYQNDCQHFKCVSLVLSTFYFCINLILTDKTNGFKFY
jgi:hypothetical protein